MNDLIDTLRDTIEEHPYLAAAAGGALLAAAFGGFVVQRRRNDIGRLDAATDDEMENELATGAIAY